jgi:hypothetical protein
LFKAPVDIIFPLADIAKIPVKITAQEPIKKSNNGYCC